MNLSLTVSPSSLTLAAGESGVVEVSAIGIGGFTGPIEVRTLATGGARGPEHGNETGRLQPVGIGPAAPVAPNNTEQGRANNCRVEIVPR